MAIFHGKVAIAVVIIHRYLLHVDFSKYVNDTFYALLLSQYLTMDLVGFKNNNSTIKLNDAAFTRG